MTIYLPLLVAIAGLLLYFFTSNAKLQEIGRIAFFCGLFVTLLGAGGESWRIGPTK